MKNKLLLKIIAFIFYILLYVLFSFYYLGLSTDEIFKYFALGLMMYYVGTSIDDLNDYLDSYEE